MYLRKLQETIPKFTSLSSIQVQPLAGQDGTQSIEKAIQTIIDFSKAFDVESADKEVESSDIHLVRTTLSRFAKSVILNLLKMLAPKVWEERYNKKCVDWAADSFLFSANPNISSFKEN